MKQIQKRYIYASLFSSLIFVILYAFLGVNIVFSILLTAISYIGGILLFKKEDIRELSSESINNYYYVASKLQNEANKTEEEKIIKIVSEISNLTDTIIVSLSQRPRKVEQVYSFFDYYLDIAYKILYKYNYEKEESKISKNIINYLESILEAFRKQNKNMQESKIIDIDTEIKMFEQANGISNKNIKVGEKDE